MWEISGEEGKRFGPDRRLASEVSRDVLLSFESLQPDRASWSVSGKLADLSDLALPELGEELVFWRNGARRFRGVVTSVPVQISADDVAAQVTIEGAHWWLEKTPLSVPETDAEGKTLERAEIAFSGGNLAGSFERLFDLAKEAGLPVSLGGLAGLFEVPQVTVSEGSFAEALAELVRLIPDAMTWWDYSGEVPAFRLTRRGSAEVLELAYGGGVLESARLAPRLGLETEEVVVQFAERGLDGEVRFRQQRAGAGSATRRQVVVTSGEALADILPPDPIDGVTLNTAEMFNDLNSFVLSSVKAFWPFWIDLQDRFSGDIPVGALTLFRWLVTDSDSTRYEDGRTPEYYLADGSEVDPATDDPRHAILTPREDLPEWLSDVLEFEEVTLSGTFLITFTTAAVSNFPDWVKFLISGATFGERVIGGGNVDFYLFYDVEVPLAAVRAGVGPLTSAEFFKPLAYQFNAPPPGFAEELRQAQGFLPYEGDLSVVEEVAGGVNPFGKVVNVSGALDEWRNARALVQGVELNLADGRQSIRCGAPARLSFSDLVTRLRASSRDNVTL